MAKSKKRKKRNLRKKRKDNMMLIFIIALIILILSVLNPHQKEYQEAKKISEKLMSEEGYNLVSGNVIVEEKLDQVIKTPYNELKHNLKVTKDFCVYFEDSDGNIIELRSGIKGIGSDEIMLNGQPCNS